LFQTIPHTDSSSITIGKIVDVVRKLISREGIGEYQKNARPLLGKGDAGITTIGYFEIDATVADIYGGFSI